MKTHATGGAHGCSEPGTAAGGGAVHEGTQPARMMDDMNLYLGIQALMRELREAQAEGAAEGREGDG